MPAFLEWWENKIPCWYRPISCALLKADLPHLYIREMKEDKMDRPAPPSSSMHHILFLCVRACVWEREGQHRSSAAQSHDAPINQAALDSCCILSWMQACERGHAGPCICIKTCALALIEIHICMLLERLRTHTRRGSSVFGIENVFHLTAAPAPAHPCDSAETASLWYPFTATPAKHALPEKQRLVCVFVVYYTLFSRSLSGLCVCVVCGLQVFVNEALLDQKCLWETTQWGEGWGVFSFKKKEA